MNTVVLRRRLIYICAMVVLLVPLYVLGNPSVREKDGSIIREGGSLAQLRTAYDLGQSDLGEMDPASESMRLATLGQRGAAIAILWQRAEFYKREKYWDRLSATLNQIAILQPHFVKVWEFQAHNLSYNVSVEFDDYRQRYAWVKRGMNYLVQGAKYNKKRTEMPYELGWFFGNKLGVADEREQFRELYRNDENFHEEMYASSGLDPTQRAAEGPDGRPDNWRVGVLWFERAYDMVAAGSRPAKSNMMFYRMAPSWNMKHAEAIQAEGILDEAARLAWERAGKTWNEFGQMILPTTWGHTIFLDELAIANEDYERLRTEFQEFCGVAFDRLLEDQKAKLTPEQIAASEKPELERTFDEIVLARQAEQILNIAPLDIARATSEEIQVEAIQKANRLNLAQQRIDHIDSYRNQINYAYWKARCVAEQQQEALDARISMYEANELLDKGELDNALEKYEVAWTNWSALFNEHPAMMIDDAAESVLDSIERYRRLLDKPDLPDDFALNDFMEFRRIYDEDLADPALMSVISSWPERFPDRNFLQDMLKSSPAVPEGGLENESPSSEPDPNRPAELTAPPVPSPDFAPTSGKPQTETPKAELPKAEVPEKNGDDAVGDDAASKLGDEKVNEEKVDEEKVNVDKAPAVKAKLPDEGVPPFPKR